MEAQSHNLFLALQPDKEAAATIERLQDRRRREYDVDLRTIRRQSLHMSLVPLGDDHERPHPVIERVKAAISTVTMPPFVVALNRIVSWKGRAGHRPLVLVGDEGVIGIDLLRGQIDAALAEAGLAKRRFRQAIPHVTLAYGQRDRPEEMVAPVRWTVREFVLVESLVGQGRHVVLHRQPLMAPTATLSDRPSST